LSVLLGIRVLARTRPQRAVLAGAASGVLELLSTAHSRKITEVRDLGTEVEVSDGVKQGEWVVLTPPVDLEDGSTDSHS
jgi:hypothetical protein